ncbi:3-(methylthio)propionyl-CoA ligase [Reyranella sp. CPCC 100927]|uniref:3-(methylthio)propionyl-CoA ligase n=1 Tax=Reyranella sp. CPCC 100927 TaxID=2599616 RepID=UPI0011B6F7C2|nr:3-(methylthio)propionyl-CoA ligase [Reyranella sp. CPCC 100927]TWT10037.1 long-chain-fatty-acid--CoA ligase [Reyranella sp. CPCC 100927]
MLGLMQDRPLLISQIIDFAAEYYGDVEIVSRAVEGPVHRYTYRDAHHRAKKLAEALQSLGIKLGDRVGTVAWNGYRHFELYYAVSGIGAVLHTLNPRLSPEHVAYIANHAEDQVIFVDLNLVPVVEAVIGQLKTVRHVIVMTDRAHMPKDSKIANLLCYEELIADKPGTLAWPTFDERTASSLCYTSGTTGNPKGVLYSHRSTVLHSIMMTSGPVLALNPDNTILPVVPMFHANAWGLVYGAPMSGCKLVFPGFRLDGASVYELLDSEDVDVSAGVPTVWLALLNYCEQNGKKLSKMKRTLIGGSAVPHAMISRFWKEHGTDVVHGWGMTEMSPVGTITRFNRGERALPDEQRFEIQAKQGRPVFGVEMKIVDDAGNDLPKDGKASGNLLVRGPWIVNGYMKGEGTAGFTKDGWFHTGDVSKLEPDGSMVITDRSKDVIKSGGEWISTIDLENAAMGHPAVAEAAVIGIQHPKWDERPLLIVQLKAGANAGKQDILDFVKDRVAKWWLPDDVAFVDAIPHGATGKVLKTELRRTFKDYTLPTA